MNGGSAQTIRVNDGKHNNNNNTNAETDFFLFPSAVMPLHCSYSLVTFSECVCICVCVPVSECPCIIAGMQTPHALLV